MVEFIIKSNVIVPKVSPPPRLCTAPPRVSLPQGDFPFAGLNSHQLKCLLCVTILLHGMISAVIGWEDTPSS